MKRKKLTRLSGMVLSFVLATTMLPVTTLAQTDLEPVNITEEETGTLLTSGHVVSLTGATLMIDGEEAQIDGRYMTHDYGSYEVRESVSIFSDNVEYWSGSPVALRHTYFTDGIGYQTSAVIALTVTGGSYACSRGNDLNMWVWLILAPYQWTFESWISSVDEFVIYVDLDTGKVVDCDTSMHYKTTFYNLPFIQPTLW